MPNHSTSILGDLGAVSRAGEKARRKFSSTGGKANGYRLHRTISKRPSECWLLIETKMLCIIVPNRRTASPELLSWVRTRRLLSRHICPVRSPSFPNQKRRNYRWVEKRLDATSRSRRFLWARNLLAKAPCWNFPKRRGNRASQRERRGGGEREEKTPYFLPSPSPLSFFRPRTYREGYYFYSPQSSTVIKSKMAATTTFGEHEQGFAHPKYACTAG